MITAQQARDFIKNTPARKLKDVIEAVYNGHIAPAIEEEKYEVTYQTSNPQLFDQVKTHFETFGYKLKINKENNHVTISWK